MNTIIGTPQRRLEGAEKASGSTRFTEDMVLPRMLHARPVLSHLPAGRITGIDVESALAIEGVVAVLDAEAIGPVNAAGPDAPLARDRVYFVGQVVALVLAETPAAAMDGAQAVLVDIEPLPAVLDAATAMAAGSARVLPENSAGLDDASVHGAGGPEQEKPSSQNPNVTGTLHLERGDVAAVMAAAEVTVRGTYTMPAAHHGFLEPHVVLAAPAPGGVEVWTPTQGHFFTRGHVARTLGLPSAKVRVHAMPVGGGFGGKLGLIEPLVAAAARTVNRPVMLALTRSEEFMVGRPAPSSSIEVEIGARRDGTLTALRARMVFDNGATSGWHCGICATLMGTYRWEAFAIDGAEVATNKVPADAYRAPGGTQAAFALEVAVDELAAELGMDPIELRLRNAVRAGDLDIHGRPWPAIGLIECLELARAHPLASRTARPGESLGVAAGAWPGGYEPAAAACRVETDGSITVQMGAVDISGSSTGLAMIAAESFGVALDKVQVEVPDSSGAPYAGAAGGSKITYSVGPAVAAAAVEARRQLLSLAAERMEAAEEDLVINNGRVEVRGVPDRGVPIGELAGMANSFGSPHPPLHGQGRAAISTASPAFTVHLAWAKVDTQTGAVAITDYLAVQDVGRAINPPELDGQVHGGVVQGLGRVLGEHLVYDPETGQLRTGNFGDYQLPTADQVPDLQVGLIEIPSPHGPFGAKGVGEPPNVPGPAAILNAISRAAGVRLRDLPFDAEALARP